MKPLKFEMWEIAIYDYFIHYAELDYILCDISPQLTVKGLATFKLVAMS